MIPLSIPNISGNEWQYVKDCLDTGWISSAGAYVNKFEEAIQNYTGVKYAIACMNGTAGLQVSLNLAGVSSNDIVIAPNLTFVATLNAISYSGAEITLIDVRDIRELWKEGTIKNSKHIPRGMLEFWLDPKSTYYQVNKIQDIKKMVLFCALGWRSALATKSLVDMGFKNVAHVKGGFDALKNSGLKVVAKKKNRLFTCLV